MESEVYPFFPLQWGQISYFYDYATDNKLDLVELYVAMINSKIGDSMDNTSCKIHCALLWV